MNITSLLIAFLTLGLAEAVVKPVAKRWVQRRILRAAPVILREVTGESWATDDLGPLFELFDLRKAVES